MLVSFFNADSYKLYFDPAFKVFTALMNVDRHERYNLSTSDMTWVFDGSDLAPLSNGSKVNFNSLKLTKQQLDLLEMTNDEYAFWLQLLAVNSRHGNV